MSETISGREIIVEYEPIGSIVRVTAMDTKSMIEVTLQGPASAGEGVLKANVLKKLEYVMRKKGLIS